MEDCPDEVIDRLPITKETSIQLIKHLKLILAKKELEKQFEKFAKSVNMTNDKQVKFKSAIKTIEKLLVLDFHLVEKECLSNNYNDWKIWGLNDILELTRTATHDNLHK